MVDLTLMSQHLIFKKNKNHEKCTNNTHIFFAFNNSKSTRKRTKGSKKLYISNGQPVAVRYKRPNQNKITLR